MATAFRKMGVYLGLVEDDDYAEGNESYGALARDSHYSRRDTELSHPRSETSTRYEPAHDTQHVAQLSDGYDEYAASYDAPTQRITTLHPRTYNEAKTI